MVKKQIIKEVFDKEFNMEIMKEQILLKKNKNKIENFKFVKYALLTSIILGICLILTKNNANFLMKINDDNSQIMVNKLIKIEEIKRNDNKYLSENRDLTDSIECEFLDNKIIPQDLDKYNTYSVLNNTVYEYFNQITNRYVKLSSAKDNIPFIDYNFEDNGKTTKINDILLKIYQYENKYFTIFKYQELNFMIETNDITLKELVTLLNSILEKK